MPEQLSSEEVNKIIDEAFLKLNPTSSKDMGLIIKEISPKVKGRTDMGEVSKIIKKPRCLQRGFCDIVCNGYSSVKFGYI